MIAKRRRWAYGLALFTLIAGGCAQLPTLTFNGDAADSGTDSGPRPPGTDASIPDLDSGVDSSLQVDSSLGEGDAGAGGDASAPPQDATTSDDAADATEDGPTDQPGDEGDAETIKCGDAMVSNCANCAEGPLRCKAGPADFCVADCNACEIGWLPCLHCPGAGNKPRGTCLPVNTTTGVISCTVGTLCACDAATDCPQIPGAAQTCDLAGGAKKRGCLPCGGAATTSNLSCVSWPSGEAGVCQISPDTEPTCQ